MHLRVARESWPLRESFAISRGTKTTSEVVVVELRANGHAGRGECVPYARYDETVDGVVAALEGVAANVAEGMDRHGLQQALPPGAARNALDCAYWDLAAKQQGVPAWRLAGLARPASVVTAYTLSLDSPAAMAAAARAQAARPLLKLKLAGADDLARVEAVRESAPAAQLIVDANEAWTPTLYSEMAPALGALGVALLEQPLPADKDAALAELPRPVPVCADESCHDRSSLDRLTGRYDAVNIKLDKTGGLTEALALADAADAAGYRLMVGCMVATSLAMAPAMLLAGRAAFVDLDGPLLLARDRAAGLRFDGSLVAPPEPALWG